MKKDYDAVWFCRFGVKNRLPGSRAMLMRCLVCDPVYILTLDAVFVQVADGRGLFS